MAWKFDNKSGDYIMYESKGCTTLMAEVIGFLILETVLLSLGKLSRMCIDMDKKEEPIMCV